LFSTPPTDPTSTTLSPNRTDRPARWFQERGAPGRGGANLGRRPRVQKEADVAPSPPAADPGPDTPGVTDRPGARATTLHCPDLPMPIATLAAALQSGQTLNDQPLLAIATLFGAGVLTSLTPCIYPMIPITAGLIASTARAQGEEPSRLRVAGLTLTYVSGLALLYALLGLIAGLSGQVFGTVSSSPWALFAIACLLVVFGLAMLDVIPVNAPRRLAAWAGSLGGGTYPAVFLLGATSGLVAAPCGAPAFAAVLTWVSTTGSAVLGFIYLFVFSLGMTALLVVVGLFSGAVAALPRSGPWMVWIKKAGGAIMFAMAAYYFFQMWKVL